MSKTSVNNRGYTSTNLSLTIIFMTGILAYLASLGMEIQTGAPNYIDIIYTPYKDFWIGCFGSFMWLFLCIVFADGEVFLRGRMFPWWVIALIFIFIGGVFTRIFTRAPDNEIVILLKGFGWPGTFVSLSTTARLNALILSGAHVTSDLSDEPTDIGETEL